LSLGAAPAALLAAALGLAPQPPTPAVPPAGPARDRAIAALHDRAADAAPGSTEAAGVSRDLERIGAAYLEEGAVDRATELLSEAYALDEENGLVLAELTLSYVRAEDYENARFYLRLAEERVHRAPPEIYGVLGDAYFGLHRLDDAMLAWSEYVRLGGTDTDVLRRLARARDELAVSRGQRSLAFDHFTVFADAGVSQELLRAAGEDLEAAYAAQGSLFGGRIAAPQLVVLYSGRAYFSLVSVPDWVSGLYDGKIRVSVEAESIAPGSSRSVLAHELAHALIRSGSRDRAPAWFHEGLAQWCEGRRIPVREVARAVGPRPASSYGALDSGFGRGASRQAVRATYAQALSLVEFLIAVRGVGAITCVLARLAEGADSLDAALGEETGFSEKQLFEGWKKWAGV
jgi:tetratricopeptide (TPR) repeat protein